MKEDLNLEFKLNEITMTPNFSRKGSFSLSEDEAELQLASHNNLDPKKINLKPAKKSKDKKQLELDCANSRLIMNTLVSEATGTEGGKQNSLEFERKNLINYIKSYVARNEGKFPKTSLQFYKILKMVGKGSFGKVHLGIHILSKKKVAIKCIDKAYIREE